MPLPLRENTGTSKYGEPTRTYSVRLPDRIIETIQDGKIDVGQLIYDIINGGLDPYTSTQADNNHWLLLKKLVTVFIEKEVDASETSFTPEEQTTIKQLAGEILDGN